MDAKESLAETVCGSCHEEVQSVHDRQNLLDDGGASVENCRRESRGVGLVQSSNDAHLNRDPCRYHQKVVFQFGRGHAAYGQIDIGCHNDIPHESEIDDKQVVRREFRIKTD